MRAQRKGLTNSFREEVSIQILNYFRQLNNIHNYKNIGVYSAFEGEVDLNVIIHWCWKNNKNTYLPKLQPENKILQFCEYASDSKMGLNKFGILETLETSSLAVDKLDLILIPLVAFDKRGHRLGMGKGYYDRTLGSVDRLSTPTPIYIGVGYAFQEVEALAPHSHDVRLDAVLTEKGLLLT